MTLPRPLTACALALVALASAQAAQVRLEATTEWAENITRSSAPIDWRDSFRYEVHGAYGGFKQWTAGLITSGEVDAGYAHFPEFEKFNAFTAGFTGEARQKFGLGPFAPVLAFDAGLHGRAARRSGDDGWTMSAGLRATKRLTTAWRAAAVTDWEQHDARSSIFDTRHHRLFGVITWDITDRLQLSHGNGRLWGDFTANASPLVWPRALSGQLGSNISEYYNTLSWGVTDSAGPGWVTYRVTGRVSFWWLELSPALGRNTSLPLRYESRFSVNKVGVKYRQDIWSLQLLHRF